MKIRFLFTSVFNVGSKAIPCEMNEIMDVSIEDGLRLIEGLCAEAVVEDTPAAPVKQKRKVNDGDG